MKTYIVSYCVMLWGGGEVARAIVIETVPELLGPDVPENAVRGTWVSIGSQILYYSYARST